MRCLAGTVLPLVFVVQISGQDYAIKTFLGGGLPDNLLGTSANLGPVSAVAVDKSGNVYMSIADPVNIVIRQDTSGKLTTVAGNGTVGYGGDGGLATDAQLFNPAGLAFDSLGNLYIADSGNNEIREVSNGVITLFAGGGASPNSGILECVVDSGPALGAVFNSPTSIAFDSKGTLYIAEAGNNRVAAVQDGVITTVAGNGCQGFGGDEGPATNAQLSQPFAIALDAGDNLYIADQLNERIRKVTDGIITTIAGTGTAGYSGDGSLATDAELWWPVSLTIDNAGRVYVADNLNNAVRVVADGIITTIAGNGTRGSTGDNGSATEAELNYPDAIALDADGDLYIGEFGGDRVRRVSAGMMSTFAGGGSAPIGTGRPTAIQLHEPIGLAMDRSGNTFIADSANNRVIEVSSGVATVVAGTGTAGYAGDNGPATGALLNNPRGVAVDGSGNLFIAERDNNCLRMVSPQGVITTIAGNGGPGFSGDNGPAKNALLYQPDGVAVDSAGNVYVADTFNNRVREITNGTITTIAGTGAQDYNGDNISALAANLSEPVALAFDSAGDLYISESDRIRRVSNGVISTFAGASDSPHYQFGGDGGPATQALLCNTWGLSFDAAGDLYFADQCSFRVRKISGGIITSIAGDGTAGFNGDGGHPATNIELSYPEGVVSDSAGNVYVADTLNNRVRVLTPATESCTYSVTPTAIQASFAGGSFPINVQTAPSCAWDSLGSAPSACENGCPAGSLLDVRTHFTDFYMPLSFGGGVGSGSIAIVIPPVPQSATQLWFSGQITVAGTPVTISRTVAASGAALSVRMTHEGSFTQGQLGAGYSVVVSNATGSAPTVGPVTVTEALPSGLVLETMSGAGWACWGNSCSRVDALGSGRSYPPITIIVDVSVDAPTSVTNQVTVSGGGTSSAAAGDSTNIQLSSGPTISSDGVRNAASYDLTVAPGSIMAVLGKFLSNSATRHPSEILRGALPVDLSGLSMNFGSSGIPAPLFDVAGGHIDAQVPWEVAGQTQSTVSVTVNGKTGPAYTVNVAPFAPGIFSTNGLGTGQGVVQYAESDIRRGRNPSFPLIRVPSLVDRTNPAMAGTSVIRVYCTGLGAVTNQPASGYPAPSSPPAMTTTAPYVSIGGVQAHVLFSGITPGSVGLYQVDALVPESSAIGPEVPVTIFIGGAESNTVTIAVEAQVVQYSLEIIAGTGADGFSGDDGPATAATFSDPEGIAVDSAGNVYIADTKNNRIRKIDANGIITTIARTGTTSSASFDHPDGLAFDAEGNLYVIDTAVRKISKDGVVTTVAQGEFRGIAIDPKGNLFLADIVNHVVRRLAPDGSMITVAGSGTAGYSGDGGPAVSAQLNWPEGLAIDSSGNLFIADVLSQVIRKVDSGGMISTIRTLPPLEAPFSLVIDASDNLYIEDYFNAILKMRPDGTTTTVAGSDAFSPPNGHSGYSGGCRLAVDTKGNVFLAGGLSDVVREMVATLVTTF